MRYHITRLLLIPLSLLTLASCSSTEIIPADNPKEKSSKVTLSITAPGAYGFGTTRDGETPQLRLTARLYTLAADGTASTTPLFTKETIHRDTQTGISFEIAEQGEYCVTVFADYIAADATATDGHYPDRYYTSTTAGAITAKTEAATISDFFNNDSRDCFVGKAVFTKGPNEYTQELILTRPVSKVSVTAPNDPVEDLISSVQVTACSYLAGYTFAIDNTSTVGTPATTATNPLSGSSAVTLAPVVKTLFCFYTFASTSGASNPPALGEIKFSLTAKEGIELESTEARTVPSGLVKPTANHHIYVSGSQGWISAKPGGDDINVNMQPLPTWSSTPGTIL